MKILIEISARHVHLCQKDLNKLFGKNYELQKIKDLSQKGEFAAKERVIIQTKKGQLSVRVVGPVRNNTQVELSKTEAHKLGIDAPLKLSGNLKGSSGALLSGPKGKVRLKEGIIIAKRHIHASEKELKRKGLKNKQIVSVKVKGKRSITFNQVEVRARETFVWNMHIDTDEANAAGVDAKNNKGEVLL